MEKVNLAIVGVGDFGLLHIKAVKQNPQANLAAICSRTPEKLKKLCEEYSIPNWFTDLDEMLSLPGLDGVIIATGEDTHYPFTKKAVDRGKHVLLEKPVCLNMRDAHALVELERRSDTHILPGHILRHDAAYNGAWQQLAGERNGKIQSIRVKRNVPIGRFSLHSRTHPVFMALAHDIDIIIWLTGSSVKNVYAAGKKTRPDFQNPDILYAVAEMENGVLCNLETQWRLPDQYGQYLDTELEVMTERGHLRLQTPGNTLATMFNGVQTRFDLTLWPEVNNRFGGALAAEIQHFIDLITGYAKNPVVTIREAVKGIAMASMLIASSESGRVEENSWSF